MSKPKQIQAIERIIMQTTMRLHEKITSDHTEYGVRNITEQIKSNAYDEIVTLLMEIHR